jgi:hypothetical protein
MHSLIRLTLFIFVWDMVITCSDTVKQICTCMLLLIIN